MATHGADAEKLRLQLEQERKLSEVVEALRGGLQRLSAGDLTVDIETLFQPEYEHLRQDFNEAVMTLGDAMTNVVSNAC